MTSGGGSKIRSQVERLKHLGARLGTADCLFQKPAVAWLGSDVERDVGLYIKREGWVLLKIPRGDIDGVGEVK